jgi:hypothetical protein
VYDDAGQVVLDPDLQVRKSIAHFFDTFLRVGSACRTPQNGHHVQAYAQECRVSFLELRAASSASTPTNW